MPEKEVTATDVVVEPQDDADGFEAITSQEDLDKIIQKRLARERNKYADYEALAAKAAKFDESVEAGKSELDKAIERAERAEEELAARRVEADRFKVIAEFNLPADLHDLITGTDVEEMRARAEKLSGLVTPQANLHQVVRTDGKSPERKPRSSGHLFADIFRDRI